MSFRLANSMSLNHAKELYIGWHLRYVTTLYKIRLVYV
jgi:hypothetical protein